jgi:hypothetical protein
MKKQSSSVDTICSEIRRIIDIHGHFSEIVDIRTVERWTESLRGFAPPRKDSVDIWLKKHEKRYLTFKEIEALIREQRKIIPRIFSLEHLPSYPDLNKVDWIILCGIRSLQETYLRKRKNMNQWKYRYIIYLIEKLEEGESGRRKPLNHETEPEMRRLADIDPNKLNHWDAMALLLQLGNLLGYDTYTSDPSRRPSIFDRSLGEIALLTNIPPFTLPRYLVTVKKIDVIWFEDEFPAYCFEVEHTTGVTRGLLRLYQVRKLAVAKLYIVSPSNIISKFRIEVEKDPFYEIKDKFIFKSYEELVLFFREARNYVKAKQNFLL